MLYVGEVQIAISEVSTNSDSKYNTNYYSPNSPIKLKFNNDASILPRYTVITKRGINEKAQQLKRFVSFVFSTDYPLNHRAFIIVFHFQVSYEYSNRKLPSI